MLLNRTKAGMGVVVAWARGLVRRASVLACAAAVGAAMLMPAAQAHAQFDMMGMMEGGLVNKRSVNAYSKLLGFDKDQTETAMTLMEGSRAANTAAMKEFQNKMQDLQNKAQSSGDWQSVQKEMGEIGTQMQEKMTDLEKQFFDDLKAICTDEQATKWERVERLRRREQGMRFGFVSGAGVDLVALADRQKLDDKGEVKELLSDYELSIDKPLMQLKRMQEEQAKRQKEMMEKMMKDPMSGMEEAKKMLGEVAEIGKDMRGINRDFARKIAAVLPEDARTKFEDEIARKSFPRVYKEAYASKLLAAATELPDLTADQKETLGQIRKSYADDARPLNEKWAKAIEAQEDKHNGTFGVVMDVAMSQAMGGTDDTTKEVNEAKAARKDLDEKIEKRVTDLLSAAQKTKMPEKVVEPENPWSDMMPEGLGAGETDDEK
ncbi:MAG: hypothetical protein WC718_03305 [Phycisphaerales bacterium]